MKAHRHDAAFVVPRFALAALLAWPMAASAQSAPVPSSSTGTTEMSAVPGMDHASMPGMTMEPVQGDPAPTDARSDDYSDGIAASPANPEHSDPRLELTDIGNIQIDRHGCLFSVRVGPVRHRPRNGSEEVIRSSRAAIVRPV